MLKVAKMIVMKKMLPSIIVRLKGGLGNQMFQYAAGRRLALNTGLDLKLDASSGSRRDRVYRRKFVLDQFDIKAGLANERESFCDLFGDFRRRFYTLRGAKNTDHSDHIYVRERDAYGFEPWLLDLPPKRSVYLDGYWMSPRYFEGLEQRLRREFRSRFLLSPEAEEEAKAIRAAANPVCLGIRTFKEASRRNRQIMHAQGIISSTDFFALGLEILSHQLGNLDLFVFTLDPEWVLQNIQLPNGARFISPKHEDERAYEDLHLMRLCRHYVISYSSYYWWGAYLSDNISNKIVVVPNLDHINANMIPEHWVRI